MAATRHNTQQVPGPFGQRRGPLTHIPHRLSFYLSLAFSSILFGFFFFFFFFFVFFFFTGRSHGGRQRQTPLPYRVLFFFFKQNKKPKKKQTTKRQPKSVRQRDDEDDDDRVDILFVCGRSMLPTHLCVSVCARRRWRSKTMFFLLRVEAVDVDVVGKSTECPKESASLFFSIFFYFFYTEQVRRRRTRSSDPACGISNAARKTKRRQRRRRTCAQWRSRTATDEKVAAPRRPTHTTGRPPNVPRPAERLEPASGRGHGRP